MNDETKAVLQEIQDAARGVTSSDLNSVETTLDEIKGKKLVKLNRVTSHQTISHQETGEDATSKTYISELHIKSEEQPVWNRRVILIKGKPLRLEQLINLIASHVSDGSH